MLTVFFNYIGMIFVGVIFAVQTLYADRKQRRLATTGTAEYDVLMTEVTDTTEPGHGHVRKSPIFFNSFDFSTPPLYYSIILI